MRTTFKSAILYLLIGLAASVALIVCGRAMGMPFPQQKYALRDNRCTPSNEEGGQIYFVSCGGID